MAGLGMTFRRNGGGVNTAIGTVEKAAASGAGVYATNYLFGAKMGRVDTPFGKMDGNLFMALVAGLSSAVEESTKGYVPSAVARYGGGIAIDATTRGVVPVVAYSALTGDRPGFGEGAKMSAMTYLGSTAGLYVAGQLMR